MKLITKHLSADWIIEIVVIFNGLTLFRITTKEMILIYKLHLMIMKRDEIDSLSCSCFFELSTHQRSHETTFIHLHRWINAFTETTTAWIVVLAVLIAHLDEKNYKKINKKIVRFLLVHHFFLDRTDVPQQSQRPNRFE